MASTVEQLSHDIRAAILEAVRSVVTELRPKTMERELGGAKLVSPQFTISTAQLQTDAAPGSAGKRVALVGRSLANLASASDSAARIEVAFDRFPTDPASPSATPTGQTTSRSWAVLNPGARISAPGGGVFREVWIRCASNCANSATKFLVLAADVAEDGQVLAEAGKFGNLNANGDTITQLRVVRRSDGASADVEGGDGSAGDRATVGVAGRVTGGTLLRTVDVDANGRSSVNPIVGQAGVDGGSGDSAATTLRSVANTIPTATATQAVAGVASSIIVAANAARSSLTIKNRDATNGVVINAGAAAVVATNFLIPAGASMTVRYRGAIHAIRSGAADVTVDLWEETN